MLFIFLLNGQLIDTIEYTKIDGGIGKDNTTCE
jgi:hypothetical protein